GAINTAAVIERLQAVMAQQVGPFRTQAKLKHALAALEAMSTEIGELPAGDGRRFDLSRVEWFDLRNMLLVARTVTLAALARAESRGAHQREDFPEMLPHWQKNQIARLDNGRIALTRSEMASQAAAQ